MRSIYFLCTTLFFLSFANLAKAQTNTYVPFPDSGAKWSGEYEYCIGCIPADDQYIDYYTYGYYFRETHDTIINSVTYHLINFANTYLKVSEYENELWYNIFLSEYGYNLGAPFSEVTVGAIREDSLHCIYYRSFGNIDYTTEGGPANFAQSLPQDSDILLYDFSLTVGETSPAEMYQVDSTFVTAITDSFLIDNAYRVALQIEDTVTVDYNNSQSFGGYDEWVEGIGSIEYGLLGSTFSNIVIGEGGDAVINLTCFSVNNQVLYPPDQEGSCDTIAIAGINTLHPSQKQSFQIYPNPASDELFLKFSPNLFPKQITIYNVIGQQFNVPYTTTAKSINVENLAVGLYFIKATDDNNVLTESFIKE